MVKSTHSRNQNPSWKAAFEARSDLSVYGENSLGLFALGVKFNIEDLVSVAADAITDGSDDKKCDIIYIDQDDGYAVIAQCYFTQSTKISAPANKASDLNTAVTWLLQRDIEDLPIRIRSSAETLRNGIGDGRIERIFIWYVHNLPESKNVLDELKTVEATANSAIRTHYRDQKVTISAVEVGSSRIEEWYNDTQSPILVSNDYSLLLDSGFEVMGPKWRAFVTSISLRFLRQQYTKHNTKLFSANVRDYLGSKQSDGNINNGIKITAEKSPRDFWAYNNGLTILVNSYESPKKIKDGRIKFKFSGMSIVNGAQTTGAVASLSKAPPNDAMVAVRFIETSDSEVVYDVIRFNNSQNKITASDFRSTDTIQRRLKTEMELIPQAEYEGGRRGGATDAIRRRPNLLPSYTVGQALAALHGDATVAYNEKANIWANDSLYAKYFNEQISAAHIVFAFSLLRAVEEKKINLVNKSKQEPGGMTSSDERHLGFLRKRGATFLLVAAVAACLEVFCQKKIPNLSRLSFGKKCSPEKGRQVWSEIVDLNLPLCIHLEDAFTYGLQNQERVKAAIQTFKSLVETTYSVNSSIYKKFSRAVLSN